MPTQESLKQPSAQPQAKQQNSSEPQADRGGGEGPEAQRKRGDDENHGRLQCGPLRAPAQHKNHWNTVGQGQLIPISDSSLSTLTAGPGAWRAQPSPEAQEDPDQAWQLQPEAAPPLSPHACFSTPLPGQTPGLAHGSDPAPSNSPLSGLCWGWTDGNPDRASHPRHKATQEKGEGARLCPQPWAGGAG